MMKKNQASEDDDYISDVTGDNHKAPMSIRQRLIIGISAAILVCALGLALPALLNAVYPAPAEAQPAQDANTVSQTPVTHKNTAGLFAVTAYATEWKETVLQPGVSVALNTYSPAQSNVPGIPFIISVPEGVSDINTDGIRIDVDAGTIISWDPPDYTVRERGKTYVCSSGTTIYWSPLNEHESAIPRCEMTITGYTNEDEAYTQKIIISHTENFRYTAELSED